MIFFLHTKIHVFDLFLRFHPAENMHSLKLSCSQNHCITEQLRLTGTSGGHMVQSSLSSRGTSGAGCPGPHPDSFQRCPRRETTQPLWAVSALSPTE